MQLLPYPMAIEVVADVHAVLCSVVLYGFAYLVELLARLADLNGFVDSLLSHLNEFLDVGIHFADLNHKVVVAVVAIVEDGYVSIEGVSIVQGSHARNAVYDNLVDGYAHRLRKSHKANRGGIGAHSHYSVMHKLVEVLAGHPSLRILLHGCQCC